MNIALDVMGGDNAPHALVQGAIKAVKNGRFNLKIILIGDELIIKKELGGFKSESISVLHASDNITSSDQASKVIKTKPDSSMVKGIRLLKEKKAGAFISCLLYTSPSPRD